MQAIEDCGQQYEAEHSDDVIERRQYGVDGDSRCNHDAQLPYPFVARPRLGARLFVRNNTKRFFDALLKELTNWISATKQRSVELLEILVVYCEEHLTMDFYLTLPLLVQGLRLAREDEDRRFGGEMEQRLLKVLELIGRYVDPETYIPITLPRVIGDNDSATSFAEGGAHSESSRAAYAASLAALMNGSLLKQLTPHLCCLIAAMSSPSCIGKFVGSVARKECVNALAVLLEGACEPKSVPPLKILVQKSERARELLFVLTTCSNTLAIDDGRDDTQNEDSSSTIRRGKMAVKKMIELVEQVVCSRCYLGVA